MFKSKQIVELLENVIRELRQIKSALKCSILKESNKKFKTEGDVNNG